MHGDGVSGLRGMAPCQRDSQSKTVQRQANTRAQRIRRALDFAAAASAEKNSSHRMRMYHGVRNLSGGQQEEVMLLASHYSQVLPEAGHAANASLLEFGRLNGIGSGKMYETCRFGRWMGFDLAAQLRYWAGPRCCRILRRLTGGGPRGAETEQLLPQHRTNTSV
jgi:hypothetical protein